MDKHLCFQCLATINKMAMNIFFHKFVVKIFSQPSVECFNSSCTKSKPWVEGEMYLYFYKQLPKLCSKVVLYFYILTSNIEKVPAAHFCNI